jgi:hypothetical protein
VIKKIIGMMTMKKKMITIKYRTLAAVFGTSSATYTTMAKTRAEKLSCTQTLPQLALLCSSANGATDRFVNATLMY